MSNPEAGMQGRSERGEANRIYERHVGRTELVATSDLRFLARNLVGDRLLRVSAELHRREAGQSVEPHGCRPMHAEPEGTAFERPTGKCEVCKRSRARGYITRGSQRLRACLGCIEKEHPVVRKPLGEGSIGLGGGSTNPFTRNTGAVDDGAS